MKSLLLAVLVLLFSCNDRGLTDNYTEMSADSLLVEKNIFRLNREAETPVCFSTGNVYTSPENNFKILVLSGEVCEEYCNPVYHSEIFFLAGKRWKQIKSPVPLSPVILIGKIPATAGSYAEYFLIDGCSKRPHAVEYTEVCNLYHLRMRKGDIEFLPMINYKMDTLYSLPVYYHTSSCEPYSWELPRYEQLENGFRGVIQEYDPSREIPCLVRSSVISYRNGIFREL